MKNILSASAENLPSFLDFEVTEIDKRQITNFTNKWFQVTQPVEYNKSLKTSQADELKSQATNDPLSTLFCLVFEEKSQLPSNCSKLYQEGLEVILSKWNDLHQFEGDQVYKNLSLQQKQDLLSNIALKTFESDEYFYQQELEQYIADYIRNLTDAPINPEVLRLNSKAVLKAIALQHNLLVEWKPGIYSFSDNRFHQYFTARGIVENSNPQALEQALQNLISHITEPRWREVLLLAVGLLQNADELLKLIKQQANAFVISDLQLQHFLAWLSQKSIANKAVCKPSAFRAFCLEFILEFDLTFDDFAYDLDFKPARSVCEYSHELQNFPFTKQQKQILQQYYDANQLLLDCLKQARYVTCTLKKEIEATLLVP